MPRNRLALFCLSTTFVMGLFNGPCVLSHEPAVAQKTEKAKLLSFLRAKDAEFDNLAVEFDESRQERIDIRRMFVKMSRYGQVPLPPFKSDVPPIPDEPFVGTVIHRVEMAVRGPELTVRRKTLSDPRTKWLVGPIWQSSETIYTTVTGKKLAAFKAGDGSGRWYLHETNANLLELQQRITFSCGFGFSGVIRTIDSVKNMGEGNVLLVGQASVYGRDRSRYEIQLDQDRIVRRALFDVDFGTHQNRIEVTTKGLLGDRETHPKVPSTAHYRRDLVVTVDGVVSRRKLDEFDFKFRKFQPNLSDKEYAHASRLPKKFEQPSVEMNPATQPKQSAP